MKQVLKADTKGPIMTRLNLNLDPKENDVQMTLKLIYNVIRTPNK